MSDPVIDNIGVQSGDAQGGATPAVLTAGQQYQLAVLQSLQAFFTEQRQITQAMIQTLLLPATTPTQTPPANG